MDHVQNSPPIVKPYARKLLTIAAWNKKISALISASDATANKYYLMKWTRLCLGCTSEVDRAARTVGQDCTSAVWSFWLGCLERLFRDLPLRCFFAISGTQHITDRVRILCFRPLREEHYLSPKIMEVINTKLIASAYCSRASRLWMLDCCTEFHQE